MRVLESMALIELGWANLDRGALDDSARHLDLALRLTRERGQRLAEARALRVLGLLAQAHGDVDEARAQWAEALAIFAYIGVPEADEVRRLVDAARRQD